MTAPLAFVDTETTSLRHDREAWEIAIIRCDGPRSHEESWFVEVDLTEADPFSLKVGGFYDRHPYGRWLTGDGTEFDRPVPGQPERLMNPPALESAAASAERIARLTHGAHLVGAVPNFDADVFTRLLRAHGLTPAWSHHLIDVEALMVGYLAGRDGDAFEPVLPWKSDDLSRWCDIEPATEEERHTAVGDAKWAKRIYDHITGTVS